MPSGRLVDYLGSGLAGDRPATPDLTAGSLGAWWATDTLVLSIWDGTSWADVQGATFVPPSGGFSQGALLVYDIGAGAFVELPPGSPGDFLTTDASIGPYWTAVPPGSGDVVGPASSTDNTLPRFNGTSGKLIEGTGIVVGDDDELSRFKALVQEQTGASYTVAETDSGTILELNNAATVTLTLPSNMPKGVNLTVVQMGAGVIDFVVETGGALVNRQGHNSSAGQYAVCVLYVSENVSGATWVLGGDTAT